MSAGLVSRSFRRWHGLGPWVCIERGGFMLHTWARYFRLPYHKGFYWRFALRWRGRWIVSKGNG